jgi:hypothetical protein
MVEVIGRLGGGLPMVDSREGSNDGMDDHISLIG